MLALIHPAAFTRLDLQILSLLSPEQSTKGEESGDPNRANEEGDKIKQSALLSKLPSHQTTVKAFSPSPFEVVYCRIPLLARRFLLSDWHIPPPALSPRHPRWSLLRQ